VWANTATTLPEGVAFK